MIAFSTDGAACVAPIDYLNEKYEGFGVLWLDVHREPVTPERFWRKRAALFSTFTGDAAQIPGLMKTSIPPSRFFFVSTRADEVPPAEDIQFHHLEIGLAKEEALDAGNTAVLDWLKASGIKHPGYSHRFDSRVQRISAPVSTVRKVWLTFRIPISVRLRRWALCLRA